VYQRQNMVISNLCTMFNTLKINDNTKDHDSGEQIHNIGQVLAIECFPQCQCLVWPGDEEMNKRDDGAFKLGAATSVHSGR
jgi:hypothetical protein